MAIAMTLQQYLSDRDIEYEVVTHPRTVSASRTAQAVHVSGERLAKAVVLRDGEGYVVAVLPATHNLRLAALARKLGGKVGLATEDELGNLFTDCDTGAVPALGTAYGLRVIVDDSLAGQPDVYFEGGDHRSLVHLSGEQFARLMEGAERAPLGRHA